MTRSVAFVIFDQFQILDLAGPLGTFEIANWLAKGDAYRLSVIAPKEGQVVSSSGAAVLAASLWSAGPIDTLIVTGGAGTIAAREDTELMTFLKARARTVRRCCSVCSGSMLLAQAGLLAGRRATTHWRQAHRMSENHPDVLVNPDAIHTHDGKFWTSAGVTAGIDLALALVQEDLGDDVSRAAAQELVVYHRRPGGQSQFSALLSVDPSGGRFSALLLWMRENLDQPLTVDQLAERAAMSPRNFSRVFLSEFGVTPARTVERFRLESARARIESSAEPFAAIAEACGFGDPDRMRRAFIRVFGQTPQAIRRNMARTLTR